MVTECIRFSKSDMASKRLGAGDQVSFQFGIDKRTRQKVAVKVTLVKKAPEVRLMGVVRSVRPALIECCDVDEELPFSLSDVRPPQPTAAEVEARKKWSRGGAPPARQHVKVLPGQEVEFSVVRERGERRAVGVELLKRGTVKFHELLPDRMNGVVTSAVVEKKPGCAERPGELERVIDFNAETNEETVEILAFAMADLREADAHVKPRVGDRVEFNVAVHKRTGKRTAGEIAVVEKVDEEYDVGRVVKEKGDFGFIRCLKSGGEVFFHWTDVEELEPAKETDEPRKHLKLRVGDDVRFVVARNTKGDPFAARISKLPRGSVVFERVLPGTYVGVVQRALSRNTRGTEYRASTGQISLIRASEVGQEAKSDETKSDEVAAPEAEAEDAGSEADAQVQADEGESERAGALETSGRRSRGPGKQGKARKQTLAIEFTYSGVSSKDELRQGDIVSFHIIESVTTQRLTAIDIERVYLHGQMRHETKVHVFKTDEALQAAVAQLDARAPPSDATASEDGGDVDPSEVKAGEMAGDAAVPSDVSSGLDGAAGADGAAGVDGAAVSAEKPEKRKRDECEKLMEFVRTGKVGSVSSFTVSSLSAPQLSFAQKLRKLDGIALDVVVSPSGAKFLVSVSVSQRSGEFALPARGEIEALSGDVEPEIAFVKPRISESAAVWEQNHPFRTDDVVRFVGRIKKTFYAAELVLVKKAPELIRTSLKLTKSEDVGPSIRPIRNPYGPEEKTSGFSLERTARSALAEKLLAAASQPEEVIEPEGCPVSAADVPEEAAVAENGQEVVETVADDTPIVE